MKTAKIIMLVLNSILSIFPEIIKLIKSITDIDKDNKNNSK